MHCHYFEPIRNKATKQRIGCKAGNRFFSGWDDIVTFCKSIFGYIIMLVHLTIFVHVFIQKAP